MSNERGMEVVEGLEALEGHQRGSAEELLDAGAHAPIDAMRHSAAHVMAEAVLDLFPAAKLGIGPAIESGFYYDFELPRPLTPDDLAAIEDRMRASVAAAHPFVRRELPFAEARDRVAGEGQSYKVEILDDLVAKAAAAGEEPPVTSFYEHGSVRRSLQGPPRGDHRGDRPVQAARGRGRVLARRREAADAPADLRDGLGDPGRAGPVPVAPRGGEEARPPQARRPARPLQLPRRQPGLGVLASQGPAAVADARVGDARAPGAARLPGGQHADGRPREAVAPVRPLGPLPRQHVPHRVRGADVLAQADELPGVDLHLQDPGPLVPRPAAAPLGVRPAPSQRALRDAVGPDPGPPLHPGRQPHLRPAGPAGRRDRGPPRRGRGGLRAGSASIPS